MTAPSLPASYAAALDTYVDAKDNMRLGRVTELFDHDAVLTLSLATANIAFPQRVEGPDAIGRTLVTDFGRQYVRCRTYYLRDALDVAGKRIDVPWLVLMREPAVGALRVGHGVYRWVFRNRDENDAEGAHSLVTHLHIHIARMDVVPDPDGEWLGVLQRGLEYPWLASATLRARFAALARPAEPLAFVEAFSEPASIDEARRHFLAK